MAKVGRPYSELCEERMYAAAMWRKFAARQHNPNHKRTLLKWAREAETEAAIYHARAERIE